MRDTYCESRLSFLSHSALWFERDQHFLINVFESTSNLSKKTTSVPMVRWLRSLQALLYLPFCLFHLWTLDPPARGKKHSYYESCISCIFCFSFMQFIILLSDHVSLPCPPADLVQEDLWGRRSPEIQAPPGNIQHRCQRDLDWAHIKFLLSQSCSHRVFSWQRYLLSLDAFTRWPWWTRLSCSADGTLEGKETACLSTWSWRLLCTSYCLKWGRLPLHREGQSLVVLQVQEVRASLCLPEVETVSTLIKQI